MNLRAPGRSPWYSGAPVAKLRPACQKTWKSPPTPSRRPRSMAITTATTHTPAARASVPAAQRRPPNRWRVFAVTGPQCHAAIPGRLGQLSTTRSDPACVRCPKVNLAVFPQDTAREQVGRNPLAPAARATPRQHQEQHPGVRGAGDADSDARDKLGVLPAEPAAA